MKYLLVDVARLILELSYPLYGADDLDAGGIGESSLGDTGNGYGLDE